MKPLALTVLSELTMRPAQEVQAGPEAQVGRPHGVLSAEACLTDYSRLPALPALLVRPFLHLPAQPVQTGLSQLSRCSHPLPVHRQSSAQPLVPHWSQRLQWPLVLHLRRPEQRRQARTPPAGAHDRQCPVRVRLQLYLPVLAVERLPRLSRLRFRCVLSLFSRSRSTLQRPGLTRLSFTRVQLPSLFTYQARRARAVSSMTLPATTVLIMSKSCCRQ